MRPSYLLTAPALGLLLLAGCSISHSSSNGTKDDNVRIATPFGGLAVKANATTADDVGLPVYPGATPIQDKDNNSANVQMGFGSFHLKVLATSYDSPDSGDKVLAWYRPAMAKYGDVLECDHGKPVGKTVASSGLTCDSSRGGHANAHSSGNHELRAGDPHQFRLVEVEPGGGQTKIGLVYINIRDGNHGTD